MNQATCKHVWAITSRGVRCVQCGKLYVEPRLKVAKPRVPKGKG